MPEYDPGNWRRWKRLPVMFWFGYLATALGGILLGYLLAR